VADGDAVGVADGEEVASDGDAEAEDVADGDGDGDGEAGDEPASDSLEEHDARARVRAAMTGIRDRCRRTQAAYGATAMSEVRVLPLPRVVT
jgi:hypothetical protein